MGEKWLSVREAADLWRVTPQTIRKWVHLGRVQGVAFSPRCIRVLVMTDEREVPDAVQGQAEEVKHD